MKEQLEEAIEEIGGEKLEGSGSENEQPDESESTPASLLARR
jgi:hypothetical protein